MGSESRPCGRGALCFIYIASRERTYKHVENILLEYNTDCHENELTVLIKHTKDERMNVTSSGLSTILSVLSGPSLVQTEHETLQVQTTRGGLDGPMKNKKQITKTYQKYIRQNKEWSH